MLEQNQIDQVRGSDAYGSDGDKLGRVGEVYLDDQTGQPEWFTVNTGLFGTNESFVPLAEASFSDGRLTVPYTKDKIKNAPNVASDGHLSPDEERQLYTYYGVGYDGGDTTGTESYGTETTGTTGTVGHDVSGPNTDDAMTLSEERVEVGTRSEETGRARLRKYVTTENVTETVPVRKEKAVLEREPITEANVDNALDGPAISEEEHEVTLREERPVVSKEAQPVERVRLGTQEVTGEETVSEEVRKEQVEAEGDVSDGGTTGRI